MKPADRALNMVIVGLGQAGGNLANEFARLGYRAIALNTAHTDLSSLGGDKATALTPEQRVYIGIDGYDGAGADMNYGRECVQENAERIRGVVSNHADGADLVIITAGLGGGTGSSVSELVRVLTPLELPLIVMATLPNEYESGIAKVNAVRAVSDLVKHQNVGWIFADNHRLSQLHGGVSLDKYFEKVNSVIIQPLDSFNRLNDRKGIHPIRTLDGEDFRALLLSNGIINYSETTLNALTVDAVCDRVRETLTSSAMMPAGFATEEVSYMGVVLEASEDVLRGTPFSFFEQLNEQHETGGAAIYMGVYRTDRPIDGGAAMLRIIASTQSLPAGVQAMVNDARREGGTLRDKLQRSMSALDLGEIEDFDLFKTTLRTGNAQSHRSRRPGSPQLSVPEMPARRTTGRAVSDSTRKAASETGSSDADPDPARLAVAIAPSGVNEVAPAVVAAAYLAPALSLADTAPGVIPADGEQSRSLDGSTDPGSSQDGSNQDGSNQDEDEGVSADDALLDDEQTDPRGLAPDVSGLSEANLGVSNLSELTAAAELSVEQYSMPPPAMLPEDPARSAEMEGYYKLVTTFLRTEFDSTRRRVARRLEAVRTSNDAVSRELVERALERVREAGQYGPFQEALGEGPAAPSS
jgi:cell division GTPase FtsZ